MQVDAHTVKVQLTQPAKFELVVNGGINNYQTNQTLYVFADAPETDVPDPDDPTVYYIGPGSHYGNTSATVWTIYANETRRGIYLAPGARLNAALAIHTSSPFRVWGRGFLYNSFQNKTALDYGPYAIALCATNVALSDFIAFGAQSHFVTFSYCYGQVYYNITVDNLKMMTTAAQTDAFRMCGPVSGITVNNTFVINNDDMVVIGECAPQALPDRPVEQHSHWQHVHQAGQGGRLVSAGHERGDERCRQPRAQQRHIQLRRGPPAPHQVHIPNQHCQQYEPVGHTRHTRHHSGPRVHVPQPVHAHSQRRRVRG